MDMHGARHVKRFYRNTRGVQIVMASTVRGMSPPLKWIISCPNEWVERMTRRTSKVSVIAVIQGRPPPLMAVSGTLEGRGVGKFSTLQK
jgi:hypothetical protein